MPTDPYATLGVKRDATPDQIRRAYRALAKKNHPDLHPGDAAAEDRFKAAASANDLLSDPEKRGKFDRGEIDGEGQAARPERQFYRRYAEGDQGRHYRPGSGSGPGEEGFADIFSELFRGAAQPRGQAGQTMPMRGQDQRYTLPVGFVEAAIGAARRLTLPDGRTLDVTIPPGLEDGQTLRLRGQGGAGWNGGPAGDALIEVQVAPHALFRREADDIHLDLPVTIAEAVLGAKVPVPTLSGTVNLSIPRHSDAGRQLRLRGRGIPAHTDRPAGDLYVTLSLVIGEPDEALEDALRAWQERTTTDPRAHLTEAT